MICDKYHIDGNGDGSDNDRDNGLVLLSSGDIYMTTSRWSSCKWIFITMTMVAHYNIIITLIIVTAIDAVH